MSLLELARAGRYVALGSSFAAGPGLSPRAHTAPQAARRSEVNYPHLLADAFGLRLDDVTSSGASTEDITTRSQHGQPPQIEAVDADTTLVTLTVGGNDIGYVAALLAASLPRPLLAFPAVRRRLAHRPAAAGPPQLADRLTGVLTQIKQRAPDALVVCVDYLTVLPPEYTDELPMTGEDWQRCRNLAATLASATATAAQAAGATLITASAASADHHAWSPEPWTTRLALLLPGRPRVPFHPNHAGMAAVADLLTALLAGADEPEGRPSRPRR